MSIRNTSRENVLDSRIILIYHQVSFLFFCLLKFLITKILVGYQVFFSLFTDLLVVSHLTLQKIQQQSNVQNLKLNCFSIPGLAAFHFSFSFSFKCSSQKA